MVAFWVDTVDFRLLAESSRWAPEIFEYDATIESSSDFSLMPVGDVVFERKEFLDPQTIPNQQINYLGLENIQSVTGDLSNFQTRQGGQIKSRSKVFHPRDILYGRLRPYLNKVYVADGEITQGLCSGEFFVLKPDEQMVRSHFLRSLLASKFVHQIVSKRQTGSALPRLPLKDLLSLEVPIPPLEIQMTLEKFILKENTRRRRLAAQLAQAPEHLIGTVTSVLESGNLDILQELLED